MCLAAVARRAPGGPPKAEPGADAGPAAPRSGAALIQYGLIRQRSRQADKRAGQPGSRYDESNEANRWPLRPEAKLRHVLPALQHGWPAEDRPWVSADVHRWPGRLSLTSSLSRRANADGCWPGGRVSLLLNVRLYEALHVARY